MGSIDNGTLSIISDEKYCYVGNSDGIVYQYDIDMCKLNNTFIVCRGQSIIDLQIDNNFLFICCEFGVILWELSLEFEINRINAYSGVQNKLKQKCVGIHFHSSSNLLIMVYESD